MKANVYETHFTVHFGFCDFENKMTPEYLLKQLQQISMEHTERENMGTDFLYEAGVAFLLARQRASIVHMPKGGDTVWAKTTAFAPNRAQYARKTTFTDKDGNVLVEAESRWVLIDIEKRRILRRIPSFLDKPIFGKEGDGLDDFRMERMEYKEEVTRVKVQYSMIDTNLHLNNAVYASLSANAVEERFFDGQVLSNMEFYYYHEALKGKEITLKRLNDKNTSSIQGIVDDRPCFECKFTFQEQKTGGF